MTLASTATASGIVALGIDNALPQGTAFQLGNGSGAPSGTFDMAGFNQTVGSIATGALFIANWQSRFFERYHEHGCRYVDPDHQGRCRHNLCGRHRCLGYDCRGR